MISAVCWVPKGACKPVPVAAEPPSKEEVEEVLKSVAVSRRDGDEEEGEEENEEQEADETMEVDDGDARDHDEVAHALAAADALNKVPGNSSALQDIAHDLQELDMDNYDDEDEGIELFSKGLGDLYYPSNDLDPYLVNKDEDEDEEEIEDMTIKPTDAVIVCARSEDEVNQLEVLVFEESEDGDSNMYVHHEIILSSFPLCMAWLDCNLKNGEKGNCVALGSMDPAIEIWDLDVVEEVKPFLVLGGMKKKKAKKTPSKYKKGSHRDSVLGLAWNKEVRNVLASGSADRLVKVWDMVAGKCAVTLDHHKDKVQSVAWYQKSPEVLLSGSFDKSVALMDVRSGGHVSTTWAVAAEVECLAWDPNNEHYFMVSLDNGVVQGFDTRVSSKPSFVLHAHDKAVTSISYSPVAPNLLATGSMDKMVKLWNISNNQPSCVSSRNPDAGAIFSVKFSEDSPFLLAVGGSKGTLEVWDTLFDSGVEQAFGQYSSRRRNAAPPA